MINKIKILFLFLIIQKTPSLNFFNSFYQPKKQKCIPFEKNLLIEKILNIGKKIKKRIIENPKITLLAFFSIVFLIYKKINRKITAKEKRYNEMRSSLEEIKLIIEKEKFDSKILELNYFKTIINFSLPHYETKKIDTFLEKIENKNSLECIFFENFFNFYQEGIQNGLNFYYCFGYLKKLIKNIDDKNIFYKNIKALFFFQLRNSILGLSSESTENDSEILNQYILNNYCDKGFDLFFDNFISNSNLPELEYDIKKIVNGVPFNQWLPKDANKKVIDNILNFLIKNEKTKTKTFSYLKKSQSFIALKSIFGFNLSNEIEIKEIKKNYIRLALKFHPDISTSEEDNICWKINELKEILNKISKEEEYNKQKVDAILIHLDKENQDRLGSFEIYNRIINKNNTDKKYDSETISFLKSLGFLKEE